MEFVVLGWPDDGPRLRLDYRRFPYAGKFVTGRLGVAVVRDEGVAHDDTETVDDEDDEDGETDRGADGVATDVDNGTVTDDDTAEPPRGESLPPLPPELEPEAFADDVLAAVGFNADRTDPATLWLRYLTVRRDLRASGRRLGPRLAAFITNRAAERGYERVRIAVNNVFAYRALYRAGFAYTGRETGLAELVLERPAARPVRPTSTAGYRRGLEAFAAREDLSTVERTSLESTRWGDPPAVCARVDDAESRLTN